MKLPFQEVAPDCDPYFELPAGLTGRWALLHCSEPGDMTELWSLDVLQDVGGDLRWLLTVRDQTADECLERAVQWIELRVGGTRPLY